MSKWDKLLGKDMLFERKTSGSTNCAGCLESYGYEMSCTPEREQPLYVPQSGVLCPLRFPKHEPIKKVYVEMVRQIVESEAKNDEDAE